MKNLLLYRKIKKYSILLLSNKQGFKYAIILFLFFLFEVTNFSLSLKNIDTNSHYIFTFWEPSNSIPGYLRLCIKTWEKNLPNNYKIVILDYHNLRNYLDYKLIKKIICKHMTLPIQADAIRVAILQKYGGFWMDCDTIITNSNFINMFYGSDLIMFGSTKKNVFYTGFIYASNNSTILKIWLDNIINRVRIYKQSLFLMHIFPIKSFYQLHSGLLAWDYLSNGIINEIIKNTSKKSFKLLERDEAYALPDMFLKKEPYENYRDFYFTSGDPGTILKNCKGVLLLHNSWTMGKYKEMPEKEFLQQNIMLAQLLSRLVNNVSTI